MIKTPNRSDEWFGVSSFFMISYNGKKGDID